MAISYLFIQSRGRHPMACQLDVACKATGFRAGGLAAFGKQQRTLVVFGIGTLVAGCFTHAMARRWGEAASGRTGGSGWVLVLSHRGPTHSSPTPWKCCWLPLSNHATSTLLFIWKLVPISSSFSERHWDYNWAAAFHRDLSQAHRNRTHSVVSTETKGFPLRWKDFLVTKKFPKLAMEHNSRQRSL